MCTANAKFAELQHDSKNDSKSVPHAPLERSWAYPDLSQDGPLEETFKPTESQIKELRSLFRIHDKDGTGVLERQVRGQAVLLHTRATGRHRKHL